jgi:ubiquinone/menaquinone biosynthesis C-methylase UbiE
MRRYVGAARYVTGLSLFCMQRIVEEEWLDRGDGTPQEIESALRSITHVNRRFGGERLHARLFAHALSQVPAGRRPRILEVASGRAEVLRGALGRLHASADITLLDRNARHLPDPQTWPADMTPCGVTGDALELPFPDASMDIVSCCLFLHHLEPPEVMRFLMEAIRVARVAVVINDLERNAIHHRLAQFYSLRDPSSISRHDGPVSVRRAYTRRELISMLEKSGRRFSIKRAYLFRLGVIVWCG